MKIGLAIEQGYNELKRFKCKSPLLDSEILLSKALEKDREFMILNSNQKIDKKDYIHFRNLIKERIKGKPIAYLTEKKAFWKYEFSVNKNVLIPRPETEIIVEQVLKIFKNKDKINLLDIGVGSGCIILSLLSEKRNFLGTGIDITKETLKICRKNADILNIKNRLKLFKTDIDNFTLGKYDLIISNPPYIRKKDLKYLDKDIKDYEPKLALNGGLEGLSEIRKVIDRSSDLIKKSGKLILEIAFDQKKEVKKLLNSKGFYINRVLKDFAKNDRCIISTKT